MPKYYFETTADKNGELKVHREGFALMPDPGDRVLLRDFVTCFQAIREARKWFSWVNGCPNCSEECHTRRPQAAYVVGQSQ